MIFFLNKNTMQEIQSALSGKSFNPANHGSDTFALSIAGFDPSAGAGILADIKTFEANSVYGFGVLSALTCQNDTEFDKVEWIDEDKIISQVAVLLRRFKIRHIKIGLIENINTLQQVIKFLKENTADPVIVFDPILRASAGFEFHKATEQLLEIMKDVYCITPNIPEAHRLFGTDDLETKLENYSEHVNIYLKGGHSDSLSATDFLYTNDHTYAFSNDRLPNGAKHGSGCVLSAALTAQLALGNDIAGAAEIANLYTYQFLASSETLLGYHNPVKI
jgi:hydroxymethylpyrimidine/phosphomethylpyrimidine kinase